MPTVEEFAARLDTLDAQQGLQSDCLTKMLTGQWVGFPSLQANLEALSPGIVLEPHPPVKESEGGQKPPAPGLASYDPYTYQPRQAASWTCSCCALGWLLRATGTNPSVGEREATNLIGTPGNVNGTYGLMQGDGTHLRRVLRENGINTEHGWLDFDTAYAIYARRPGAMSGRAWYHWTGVRGVQGPNLWLANSAPGYKGVADIMSRADFQRLGPFSCVWIVP
jgi:hypothetical protein